MSWGRGGKYWNVGLSEPGRLAATRRQLWYLHLLSGRKIDYRGRGLTRDQAAELIDQMKKERSEADKDLVLRDAYFSAIFTKATEAADAAGDDWMREHDRPLFKIFDQKSGKTYDIYDRIGEVYIKWPKDTVFGTWLKRNAFNGQYDYVYIPHKYHGRPEYGLQKVTVEAAYKVLDDAITGLKMVDNDYWT